MAFTFRERFIGTSNPIGGGLYAPLTIGSPEMTHPVDYSVFKKTKQEKLDVQLIKSQHKKDLLKAYGKGNIGRKLNVTTSWNG